MADCDSHLLGEVLAAGDEIERFVVRVLSSLSLTQDAVFEQFLSAMAVRCLNFFRATLLLSRQGLGQPASSCVRCLIEQRWVYEAVTSEDTRDEALRWLNEHSDYNRKNACDNLLKLENNQRDQRITNEVLDQLKTSITTGKKHFVSDWAKLAKRDSEYLVTYTLLCDRTHPSSMAIESHVLFDDSGQVLSLTANPDTDSLPRDVLQACEVMIDAISASPNSWQTEDVVAKATELRMRILKLWELVPDLLTSSEFVAIAGNSRQ